MLKKKHFSGAHLELMGTRAPKRYQVSLFREASTKAGERTLSLDVFRQLRPAFKAKRAGHQELSVGNRKGAAFIPGVRRRA